MKEMIIPKMKYPKILSNLFARVYGLDPKKVSANFNLEYIIIEDTKKIDKEIFQKRKVTGSHSIWIHWLEATVMLLNELYTKDSQIDEFSHTYLQALLGNYDTDTLHPEQYLIRMYKSLPEVKQEFVTLDLQNLRGTFIKGNDPTILEIVKQGNFTGTSLLDVAKNSGYKSISYRGGYMICRTSSKEKYHHIYDLIGDEKRENYEYEQYVW